MKDGRHHDSYFWDFARTSQNRDVSDMDKLIARMVKKYNADEKRIYMIGWSEGALFSQIYGMIREQYSSPYGHKIAAIVAYSGSNPFKRRYINNRRCEPKLNFKTNLPILFMSRSCDIIPCNSAHENLFTQPSWADAAPLNEWMDTLKNELGNKNISYVMIDDNSNVTNRCSLVRDCHRYRSVINHIKWPKKQEQKMLKFLFNHKLKK